MSRGYSFICVKKVGVGGRRMTKYKCNHCRKDWDINYPYHQAGLLNIDNITQEMYYCSECVYLIARTRLDNSTT
jgi:transposase-like protein